MKLFVLLSLAFASTAQAITSSELDTTFAKFKSDYDRAYKSVEEERYRKSVFAFHLDFIHRHNHEASEGRHSFIVGVNNFTDLTTTEFVAARNGFKHREGTTATADASSIHVDERVDSLPASVDWTTKGVVTPVKNQGDCGSCWSFSATGAIEAQHALATGKLVSLSEQNLIDCSYVEGDLGCFGGLMDHAFKYVIKNHGLDTESSYPYTATWLEFCKFKRSTIGATIRSYVDVKKGSESALQCAVATVGPISVAIDASRQSFQLYASGVYDEPACSTSKLDHGVLAVGYGTLDGKAYWKVKNSWGASWGLQGYILMSRNKANQCGIATSASYPVV